MGLRNQMTLKRTKLLEQPYNYYVFSIFDNIHMKIRTVFVISQVAWWLCVIVEGTLMLAIIKDILQLTFLSPGIDKDVVKVRN